MIQSSEDGDEEVKDGEDEVDEDDDIFCFRLQNFGRLSLMSGILRARVKWWRCIPISV